MHEKTTIRTFGLVSLKQNVILNICTLTEIKIPKVLKTSVEVFIFHRLSRLWKWWILFSELSKSVRTGVGQFITGQFTTPPASLHLEKWKPQTIYHQWSMCCCVIILAMNLFLCHTNTQTGGFLLKVSIDGHWVTVTGDYLFWVIVLL